MCLLCLFVIWRRKNGSDVTAKQILTPALKIKRRHQYKRGKTLIYTALGGLGGRIQWQPLLNFLLWHCLGACLIAWKEAQRAETRLVQYYYYFLLWCIELMRGSDPKKKATYATPTWGLSSRCGAHQQFITQGNLIFYKGSKHPQMFNSFLFIVPYVFCCNQVLGKKLALAGGPEESSGFPRRNCEELWCNKMETRFSVFLP